MACPDTAPRRFASGGARISGGGFGAFTSSRFRLSAGSSHANLSRQPAQAPGPGRMSAIVGPGSATPKTRSRLTFSSNPLAFCQFSIITLSLPNSPLPCSGFLGGTGREIMGKTSSAEFAQNLAARLIALRREFGLQYRDMAKMIGITERVYRRYEAAEQIPGSDKLMALLKAMKEVNPEWLLMGTGRVRNAASDRQQWQAVLDIIESQPLIPKIINLLQGLNSEDLEVILNRAAERKSMRKLHNELRSMMNQLTPPATAAENMGDSA